MTPIAESNPRTTLAGTNDLINPPLRIPSAICITPARTTATNNPSNEPITEISAATTAVRPAAGPEIVTCAPLRGPTMRPATTPATTPASGGAFDASAMPIQRGSATRKTTTPASTSSQTLLTLSFFSAADRIFSFICTLTVTRFTKTRRPTMRFLTHRRTVTSR